MNIKNKCQNKQTKISSIKNKWNKLPLNKRKRKKYSKNLRLGQYLVNIEVKKVFNRTIQKILKK
jgi:hypothetical protein